MSPAAERDWELLRKPVSVAARDLGCSLLEAMDAQLAAAERLLPLFCGGKR